MCRTGGRRCDNHWDEGKRKADLARRRHLYHAKKTAVDPSNQAHNLHETFFADSTARNTDGTLINVYHGSEAEFASFDSSRLGQGNDTWGNGFYFTTSREIAEGYGGNAKEFHLNMKNPIRVDGRKHMSLSQAYVFKAPAVAHILRSHPLAYVQPTSEEDMNFLGDYAPNFWDKDEHTREEFDEMIDHVAAEYFQTADWATLEGVFGRDHGAAFLEAVHRETGHDGVVVEFDDTDHYIAWFPNQMKLTSNQNPQNNEDF